MPRVQIGKTVIDTAGNVQAGVDVYVYDIDTVSEATVYQDDSSGTTLSQPLSTDSNGIVPGWVEEGAYDISVGGVTTELHAFSAESGGDVYSHASRHDTGGADAISALNASVITAGEFPTARLADSAVTAAKLGTNAVTEGKIASDAVTFDKRAQVGLYVTDAGRDITSTTLTTLEFTSVTSNPGSGWSSPTYTIPSTGWYLAMWQGGVRPLSSPIDGGLEIYIEGGVKVPVGDDGYNGRAYFGAGDTVEAPRACAGLFYRSTGQSIQVKARLVDLGGGTVNWRIGNMALSIARVI